MSKKSPGFFQRFTLARSLAFLSLFSTPLETFAAKVNPPLDETVRYTMNFRNVNIIEYIRFVAKISKTNFIFNEQELNFPVTLVSDQPVSARNLFSALVQTLEVNGFSLSEQEGSVLITKNPGSSQLAPINQMTAPLVTRIYKINNINLVTLSQVVKQMISKSAVVESILETHQLIVTDTAPNLDRLAQFITDLDSGGSNLKIFIYVAKNQSPSNLADMLKQVMVPFQSANTFLAVPQAAGNQIIIISTPYLVQQAQEALNNLDIPTSTQQMYIYHIQNLTPEAIETFLHETASKAEAAGDPNQIVQAIDSMRYVSATNSIVFSGSEAAITQLQEILTKMDQGGSKSIPDQEFFIYPLKNVPGDRVIAELKEFETRKTRGTTQQMVQAIDEIKWLKNTNSLLLFGTPKTISALQALIDKIDVSTSVHATISQRNFVIYSLKGTNGQAIADHLHDMANQVDADSPQAIANQEALRKVKYVPDTNSMMIFGNPDSITFVEDLLGKLDTTMPPATKQGGFVVFPLESQNGQAIADHLHAIANDVIADSPQSIANQDALRKVKYVPDTNSMMIFGNEESIAFVENLIEKLDKVTPVSMSKSGFVVYPLLGQNGQSIVNHLHEMAKDVMADSPQAKANQDALKKVKYIADTNSMMIVGNPQAIEFVENLVAKLDIPPAKLINPQSSYSLYTVKGTQGKQIAKKLNEFANLLPKNTPHDKAVQDSLRSAKYIPETNSIIIQGTEESIAFVSSLAEKMDEGIAVPPSTSFIVYKVKGESGKAIVAQLHDMSLHVTDISQQSQDIKSALQTARFMPDTNSIMISGTKDALTFTESILQKIDVLAQEAPDTTFSLYQLQQEPGNTVIEKLQRFAKKLPSATPSERYVINSIERLQWIQESNSILIAGNQQTIDHVSSLIAQYDSKFQIKLKGKEEFFIYSPVHLSIDALEENLQEYGVALKQSGLADTSLLETINTAKLVPSANHIVFTGDAGTLTKIKSILATIDQGTPHESVQQFGQSSFLVHQLRSLAPEQFEEMMKSFDANLVKSGSHDPQISKSISNMQYLKETNSFLFTGPASALDKIAQIADKIDVAKTQTAQAQESSYDIYNPQHVDGIDLIEQMCQFARGLSDSGVKDQTLFDTINNIKWIEKSNAMVITGSPESIAKVQDLLKKFDVPGTAKPIAPPVVQTGFMVYKLQYHSGTEIQQALNKLAPALTTNGATPNPGLAQAINSIQWIQMTNSLVASGDPENLEKLKTLISEIDAPLKQVFIEVLVVETDSTNTQNFGLQWFGKGQIKNQLGFGTGNFGSTNPLTQSTNLPSFSNNASNINLSTPPTGQSIPFLETPTLFMDLLVQGLILV